MDSLPTEILLELPLHLPKITDIVSLSQTNRRFHLIFNPILYSRDAASPTPVAPFWGAEHGLLPTLLNALAAGADLTQRRDFSRPRSVYGPRWRYSGGPPPEPSPEPPALRKRSSMSAFLDRVSATTSLRYWWGPLDLAAFNGHGDVVRFLVEEVEGVSVLRSGSRGLCAFGLPWCAPQGADSSSTRSMPSWPSHSVTEAAQCAGHGEVAELLRELGRVEQARTGSVGGAAAEGAGTGART